MSDVCKHCVKAPCLEVCPTGAIIRTEFDTVYIQEPVCNGCRGLHRGLPVRRHPRQRPRRTSPTSARSATTGSRTAWCPPVHQACPTRSIQFGPIDELKQRAEDRVESSCTGAGSDGVSLRGRRRRSSGGLNAFYLLMDPPETYGLPSEVNTMVPSRVGLASVVKAVAASLVDGAGGVRVLRQAEGAGPRERKVPGAPTYEPGDQPLGRRPGLAWT